MSFNKKTLFVTTDKHGKTLSHMKTTASVFQNNNTSNIVLLEKDDQGNFILPKITATRHLYSPITLGLPKYEEARTRTQTQFANVDHLFIEKMNNCIAENSDSIVFTEDLKTMVHLVEKKPEHLDILYKMLLKYHNQINMRFGNFIFGTVIMRALYYLDEPDLALQAYKDEKLCNMFDQISSVTLLMDLLYNHGKYQEVRNIYDVVKDKVLNGVIHHKNLIMLVTAACYKENTEDSLDYALSLIKELQSRGFYYPGRAISFTSALALNQNKPSIALEILSLYRKRGRIEIRCLQIEAFIHLKRLDEILVLFRKVLQSDSVSFRKESFFSSTIEKVEQFIKDENIDENSDIVKMLKQLQIHEHIRTGSIDEYLCTTVELKRRTSEDNMNPRPERRNFNEGRQRAIGSDSV